MVAHEAKPSPGRDEGDPDKPDRWIKHKMLQETETRRSYVLSWESRRHFSDRDGSGRSSPRSLYERG